MTTSCLMRTEGHSLGAPGRCASFAKGLVRWGHVYRAGNVAPAPSASCRGVEWDASAGVPVGWFMK